MLRHMKISWSERNFFGYEKISIPKGLFWYMAITSHVDVNRIWHPKRYLNILGSQKFS